MFVFRQNLNMNRPETLKRNNIVDRAHLHLVSERVTARNAFPLFLRVLAPNRKKHATKKQKQSAKVSQRIVAIFIF